MFSIDAYAVFYNSNCKIICFYEEWPEFISKPDMVSLPDFGGKLPNKN